MIFPATIQATAKSKNPQYICKEGFLTIIATKQIINIFKRSVI